MALYLWNKKYSIGDASLDSQHQGLFEIANYLVDSRNQVELTDNIVKLHNYCQNHFSHEEGLMGKLGYPDVKAHVALHDQLMTRLNAISDDIAQGRWSRSKLEEFMNEWLLGHILKEDLKLVKFARKA